MIKKSCIIMLMSLFFLMSLMIGCDLFQEETTDVTKEKPEVAAAKTSLSEECAAVIVQFEGVDKESAEGKTLIEEYYKVCGPSKD